MKSILYLIRLGLLISIIPASSRAESVCYGTTQNGRLEMGEKLPKNGANFITYSDFGWAVGRTFVHSKVKEILLDGFKELQKSMSEKIFVYGETGWEKGGSFKPHKTHQNGLSVDLMVPIIENRSNKSVPLPTNILNKWGYSIEFNQKGIYKDYSLDFEALGELIFQLQISADRKRVKIWRVIFDPMLVSFLYSTKRGSYIKKNIFIPNKKSWVRHDEHIHVDFEIPCKPL